MKRLLECLLLWPVQLPISLIAWAIYAVDEAWTAAVRLILRDKEIDSLCGIYDTAHAVELGFLCDYENGKRVVHARGTKEFARVCRRLREPNTVIVRLQHLAAKEIVKGNDYEN